MAMGSLTPSTNSTITTTSSSSTTTATPSPFHLLEITIISAQDLAPVSKSMRTYAVVWVQPERKLTTRVDHRGGHANPTWNDKFVFRIDEDFLNSDTSAVMVEIYTVSWFRDNLVGNVKVLISNLIPPFARVHNNFGTRFVALQVRRASGSPQGILNMAVSLLDSSMRSMPIYKQSNADGSRHDEVNTKIQLWRSRSEKSDLNFDDFYPPKGGSICNAGSIVNGSVINDSELCSDVGPSASIVAAAIAKGLYPPPPPATAEQKGVVLAAESEERGSSILEDLTVEEARAKGYKSRRAAAELPAAADQSFEKLDSLRHSRRHSDGGPGLFSCFAYGFEFTIVCGSKNEGRNNKNNGIDKPMIKRSPSHQNLSL
ncbi:hypothetical protein RHGRI_001954 [Rhododendron griersonianum]|uniref:C2 domain-containing protein n=1 Tax=Rhododendron griersonianum TaxID=479676 RepID=A0AAV6LP96_9ERIC|nr:hypothetical protein RHGRI_001954 [Rhododendron griersonianum]